MKNDNVKCENFLRQPRPSQAAASGDFREAERSETKALAVPRRERG